MLILYREKGHTLFLIARDLVGWQTVCAQKQLGMRLGWKKHKDCELHNILILYIKCGEAKAPPRHDRSLPVTGGKPIHNPDELSRSAKKKTVQATFGAPGGLNSNYVN